KGRKEIDMARANWVRDRMKKAGFSADEIRKVSDLATDAKALHDEYIAPFRNSQTFARFYATTVREGSSVGGADQVRLFMGKQLDHLRSVLAEEKWANAERFSDEDIAAILQQVSQSLTAGEKGIPSNLRYRSPLDGYAQFDATEMLEAEGIDVGNGVSFTANDFFNRDIGSVTDRYNRSMAGAVAINKVLRATEQNAATEGGEITPILTHQALLDTYAERIKAGGLDPTKGIGKAAYIRLEAGIREIMGIPQPTSRAGEALRPYLRTWRKLVNARLNGTFQFATMPESLRIAGYGNIQNVFNAIPMFKEQLKLAQAGKMSNEQLDLSHLMHGTMTSSEHNPMWSMIDVDDPRNFGGSSLIDKGERIATGIERASFVTSGQIHLDRMLRRLAAGTAINKYVNDFARGKKWNAGTLQAHGMSVANSERVAAAIKHELAKPGGAIERVKSWTGHRTTKFRLDQFEDTTAAWLLVQSMSKWSSRVFQESTTGSKLLIQTDPTLGLLTHFLDFAIQGWEKHTLYGIQNWRDSEVYVAMLLTGFAGSLTYMAQTHIMHGQNPEQLERAGFGDEWQKYRIFMAGVQRGGQFAIPMQAADLIGANTGMGVLSDSRASGLSFYGETPLESNPSTDTIDAVRRAMQGVGRTIFHGDDFSRQDADAIWKSLPMQKHPVINNLLQAVTRNLPEESRD
ncbi:MAG: hypothetical protein P1V36_14710, partial [Planctomycetota bacterium]|nr:hypothetical protein [Planctomycetota bacterium]